MAFFAVKGHYHEHSLKKSKRNIHIFMDANLNIIVELRIFIKSTQAIKDVLQCITSTCARLWRQSQADLFKFWKFLISLPFERVVKYISCCCWRILCTSENVVYYERIRRIVNAHKIQLLARDEDHRLLVTDKWRKVSTSPIKDNNFGRD